MRILHVWDQAGVAACMVKYQRRLGHTANVVKLGNWDGKGIDEYYNVQLTIGQKQTTSYLAAKKHLPKNKSLRAFLYKIWKLFPTIRLYLYVVKIVENYDVLHIHGVWPAFFFIPLGKPAIMEFHGDDVRRKPSLYNWFHRMLVRCFVFFYSLNHKIYVSTPDLISEVRNSVYIPNPVDVEHFTRTCFRKIGSALYSSAWFESYNFADEYAKVNGLDLTILNRKMQSWIDYREFPEFLGTFEYYIDRRDIHSLSKTALEALYMGLKVVDWRGHVLQGLPQEHYPENVAERTLQIYQEVIRS